MPRNRRYPWIAFAAGLLAGAALLGLIIWRSGFDHFLQTVGNADIAFLVLAAVLYSLGWLLRTFRLQKLAGFSGLALSRPKVFRYSISGFALNVILPARLGDAALVGYLRAEGLATGRAAALVVHVRLLDAAAVTLLASALLPLTLGFSSPGWLLFSLPVPFLVMGALWLLTVWGKKIPVFPRLEKAAAGLGMRILTYAAWKLREAASGYHDMLRNGRLVFAVGAISLLLWFLEGLVAVVIALALDIPASISLVILGVCAGNLGKAIPLTPGGLGVYEGLMAAVLTLGGVPYPQASVLAVCDHLLKKLFNLAVGLPFTAVIGISLPRLLRTLKGMDLEEVP